MKDLRIFGKFIALFISTSAFTGMLPWLFGKRGKYGGTSSSIATTAVMIWLYDSHFHGWMIFLAILLSLIVGFATVSIAEQFMFAIWGERQRHTGEEVSHDFNETTIDEVHGMFIAMLPIYLFDFSFPAFCILHAVAFLWFRYFDAKKIGPVKLMEDDRIIPYVPASIMLDDTVAGLMAMGVTLFASIVIYVL